MIKPLTLSQLAIRFGGTLCNPDASFNSVSTDSRSVAKGDLFVALVGESFDAHNFLDQVANTAVGLVVNAPQPQIKLPQWVVEDTTVALGQIGLMNRDNFDGLVLAITGSSGKTTVKGMAAAIMAQRGPVHFTQGNLNNHIGVPQTLFQLNAEHQFSVIEMGASALGEIAYLCTLAKPDIAMINNVMPAHVEGFGSIDGVAKAKGEIYQGLSNKGKAVVNLDDAYAPQWLERMGERRAFTYSVANTAADFYAQQIELVADGCYRFMLQCPMGQVMVELPVAGKHNIANALAAAACSWLGGATLAQISAGLASFSNVERRLKPIKLASGATLIDDCYNANPGSVKAAIDVLKDFGGTTVLVLGDMNELGSDAALMHREVGQYARKLGIDHILTIGNWGADVASTSDGELFDNFDALNARVCELATTPNTTLLVKGSRGARMERVVDAIKNRENT